MKTLILDSIAQCTSDWFLACYFVEGLRAPLAGNNLIGHCQYLMAELICEWWPDPGLSRNTRCRCYRCSVPGLAGFTRLALCGARDLIKAKSLSFDVRTSAINYRTIAGGEGGIRTHGTVSRSQHFQCCQFNHSCTSPRPQSA